MTNIKVKNSEIVNTSVRILEYLIDNEYITEFEDEKQWDYHIQDIIEDEIKLLLGIKE